MSKKSKKQTLLFASIIFIYNQTSSLISEEIYNSINKKKYSFEEVSQSVLKNSLLVSALEKESASAITGKERTSRHWHPKLYLEGRAFSTNDPAINFFSILGQREARQSDFSTKSARTQVSNFLDGNNQPYTTINPYSINIFAPDTLNNPGFNSYQRGTLGIDIPLYEGGAKSSISKSYEYAAKAKNLEKKAIILSEYSSTAALYSQLILIKEYKDNIQKIKQIVNNTLSGYQVGARSNPVGYSGLLGLKTLKNRLDAYYEEANARESGIIQYLNTIAEDLGNNWEVIIEPIPTFLDKHLPLSSTNDLSISLQSQAMKEYAESLSTAAEAEKARFLPKIGVFGESNVYGGSRNVATSANVGFYVQMNLYNGEDLGSYNEAKLKVEAAREKSLDQIRKEEARKKEIKIMETTLKKQLDLLDESFGLMDEQVSTARRLFVNGSINAIQFSAILSQYADLVLDKANTMREYILIRSEIYTLLTN